MGKGALDPTTWAIWASIWSAITAIWNFLTTLWNFIHPVWDVITKLWDGIKKVWDYLSPLVKNIYTAYIKPIKDLLTTLWSKFDALIDWVDKIYKNTIGRIETVYDLLFGKYEKLWADFITFRDKAVRLIDKIDPDLAAKIYRETERIEGQTLGQIRNVRDELTSKVNEYYHTIRDYVNERYQALKDLVDPYIAKAIEVERHLKISWDKPGQLSEESMTVSIAEHAHPFEKILTQKTADHADDDTFKRLEEMGPDSEIDTYLNWMEAEGEGPWSDVHHTFEDIINRIDNNQPPSDYDMDLELTPLQERLEIYDHILNEVTTGRMSWMPTWLIWTCEKAKIISGNIAESWRKWNEDYNNGFTGGE